MERWRNKELKSQNSRGVRNQQRKLVKSEVTLQNSRDASKTKRSSQNLNLVVPTATATEVSSSSAEDNDNSVILRSRSPSISRHTKSDGHLPRSHSVDHVQWTQSSGDKIGKTLSQESLSSECGVSSNPSCSGDASSQTKSLSLPPHRQRFPILINGSYFLKGGNRSPNLARRLKALVTLTPSKKSINFEKRHSDPNYLDGYIVQNSMACNTESEFATHSNCISPYFSQLDICCANKPSFRAFISAIHTAPRLRYIQRATRKEGSRSRSRDRYINRSEVVRSSVSILTDYVPPSDKALVYLSEDSDIKCNVDYEIFRVLNYGSLLIDMKEEYDSDTEDFNLVQLIIEKICDVTKEADRIKDDAKRLSMQRLGSSACIPLEDAGTTATDLDDNSSSERRNTVTNLAGISAVLMRLRNGSRKSRGGNSNSSQRLQDFLPSYCGGFVFESEVFVTRLTKGKDKGKEKARILTLFTDRILICKTNKEKVKDKSLIEEVWLSEADNAAGALDEAVDQVKGNTFLLGWPLINYCIRSENVESRYTWLDLLNQAIKTARNKIQLNSETTNIKIVLDVNNKDLSMSHTTLNSIGSSTGCSKCVQISAGDDVNTCLQRALCLFNIQETSSLSNMQLWATFNDVSPIKLIGHELPYWIVLWSMRRQRTMSSSATLGRSTLTHRQLSLSSEGSLDCNLSSSLTSSQLSFSDKCSLPPASQVDEQFKIKFILRQKKEAQRNSSNGELEDLNSSNGQTLLKSHSKSRNLFTNWLGLSTRSKPDDSDSSSPPCTKKEFRGQLFGRPLHEVYPHGQIGPSLMALLGFAYAYIPNTEGPFRVTGNIGQIKRLQTVLDNIDPLSDVDLAAMFEMEINTQPSPATILGLIKKLINSIPDKLLQQSRLERWMKAWQQPTDQLRIEMIQALFTQLPPINVTLMELFVCLCDLVLKHGEITKLNAIGLSTSVAPSLLTPLISQNIEAQCEINELFAFIIDNFANLWPKSGAHQVLDTLKPNFSAASSSIELIPSQVSNSDVQHLENGADSTKIIPQILLHISSTANSTPISLSSLHNTVTVSCNIPESKQDVRQRPQPYHNLPLIRSAMTPIHSDMENFKSVIPRRRGTQYRLLRPNSMVEGSLNNVTLRPQAPPSYQEAVERQAKLRLTDSKQSSRDAEDLIDQKVPHRPRRCHSVDRRALTRHNPPVQLTFKNGRNELHRALHSPSLQPTNSHYHSNNVSVSSSNTATQPHWLAMNSETCNKVQSTSQLHNLQTRHLPNELQHILKHEDESYV